MNVEMTQVNENTTPVVTKDTTEGFTIGLCELTGSPIHTVMLDLMKKMAEKYENNIGLKKEDKNQ